MIFKDTSWRMMRASAAIISCFLILGQSPGRAEGAVTLRVFEWEGYISPFVGEFEKFAREKGMDVKVEFIKNSDNTEHVITSVGDVFEEIRRGSCDIVTPTNNYFKDSDGRLLKLLAPIDVKLLANYPDLGAGLQKASYAEEGGQKFGIPLLGGEYRLAYNADRVKQAPTTWRVLMDNANSGRISVTDSQFEANIYVAAMMAGSEPENIYDVDHIDLKKTSSILSSILSNVRVFWDGSPDIKLMSKDLDYITDYGFAVAMANSQGQHWRFADTQEPTTAWIDNLSVTKQAMSNPDKVRAAHLLIDFMISPMIQARLSKRYGIIVMNPKARDTLPETDRDTVRIMSETMVQSNLLWKPLDVRTRNYYRATWNDAVASTFRRP